MRKVTIMTGASGSGKSTWIQDTYGQSASVVSADHYFLNCYGTYEFDPKKLGLAHGACLRQFTTFITTKCNHIVVDNTSTRLTEMAPYVALAQAYGYDLEIVCINFSLLPTTLAVRNTHNVALSTIRRQKENMSKMFDEWPRHWPSIIFHNTVNT